MQSIVSDLIESAMAFPGEIVGVAAQGPIAAVLVGMGALLMAVAMGVFGYLSLGAAVSLVTPN